MIFRPLLIALCPALLMADPPGAPHLGPTACDGVPVSPMHQPLAGPALPEELDLPVGRGRALADQGPLLEGDKALGSNHARQYENPNNFDLFMTVDRSQPANTAAVYFAPAGQLKALDVVAGRETGRIRVPAGSTMLLGVAQGQSVMIHVHAADGSHLDSFQLAWGAGGAIHGFMMGPMPE
jgi:hypothetical protein